MKTVIQIKSGLNFLIKGLNTLFNLKNEKKIKTINLISFTKMEAGENLIKDYKSYDFTGKWCKDENDKENIIKLAFENLKFSLRYYLDPYKKCSKYSENLVPNDEESERFEVARELFCGK